MMSTEVMLPEVSVVTVPEETKDVVILEAVSLAETTYREAPATATMTTITMIAVTFVFNDKIANPILK